jgi:tyrosinase
MNLRKNQSSLSASEREAFISAILELKEKPSLLRPGDRNFGRYDDFVQVHYNAMMPPMMSPPQPGWAHQSVVFAPWHRVLLLKLEKELQAIDPSVTIPYWDWTKDSTPTSSLWSANFLGGNGKGKEGKVVDGPFSGASKKWPIRVKDDSGDPDYLRRQMMADPSAKSLPSDADQAKVLAMTPYDTTPWEDAARAENPAAWKGFRPHLEVDLHNLVHRWIGGNMVDMTSPNDPVFWLHHCNCDRLWAIWQLEHPKELPYLPSSGAAVGHNLNDIMIFHLPNEVAPWEGNYRPYDVLDHQALGVAYDNLKGEVAKFEPRAWESGRGRAKALPAVESAPLRRTLPMFVLAPELPALAGEKITGSLLNPVVLNRIPKRNLIKFSKEDKTPIARKALQGIRIGASGTPPPAQTYTCPVDDIDVTAQVQRSCQIAPAGSVIVQCPKGDWVSYLCPS